MNNRMRTVGEVYAEGKKKDKYILGVFKKEFSKFSEFAVKRNLKTSFIHHHLGQSQLIT